MKLGQEQLQEIESWMRAAGKIALDGYPTAKTHLKADRTPVTDVEYRIEAMLVEQLVQHYPGCQIISEEAGVIEASSDYVWALDPIDGTKSFVNGLPVWGVSLGLLERGQPHTGFLYLPALDEFYLGSETGAYWNGQRMDNLPGPDYEDPLSFIATPSNVHRAYDLHYSRVQAYGCTAAHLALVARGVAIAALTRSVYIWDVAGVLPVLQQTGIVCEYLSGEALDLNAMLEGERSSGPLLAARPQRMQRLREDICVKPRSER